MGAVIFIWYFLVKVYIKFNVYINFHVWYKIIWLNPYIGGLHFFTIFLFKVHIKFKVYVNFNIKLNLNFCEWKESIALIFFLFVFSLVYTQSSHQCEYDMMIVRPVHMSKHPTCKHCNSGLNYLNIANQFGDLACFVFVFVSVFAQCRDDTRQEWVQIKMWRFPKFWVRS